MVQMRRLALIAAAMVVASGCLVPKDQFDQMVREAELNAQRYKTEADNAAALDKRLKEVELDAERLRQQKQELEAQLTDKEAERRELQQKNEELTALNQELAKNTKQLEQAKEELEKKSSEYESLAQSLKGEIQAGKVELSEMKGRMTVKMKDKILFSSGSARVGKEGEAALDKVAQALKDVKGKIIRVEGHTDSDPVDPKGDFASNWELSLARAMAVVKRLQDQGVDPTKLSVAGYGQYQPIAANNTPEHKSLNRRIEIVLAPAIGSSAPTPAAEAVPAKGKTPAPAKGGGKKK
jgi:chemotaxis protein MotB